MTTTLPEFKRGDSFAISCTYKQNGTPHSVFAVDIKCQVKQGTTLVTEMNISKADQAASPGVFVLLPQSSDTALWPLGNLLCDIQFTEGGVVRSTETFYINIIEQVTT
jgi:hypothetical protein